MKINIGLTKTTPCTRLIYTNMKKENITLILARSHSQQGKRMTVYGVGVWTVARNSTSVENDMNTSVRRAGEAQSRVLQHNTRRTRVGVRRSFVDAHQPTISGSDRSGVIS